MREVRNGKLYDTDTATLVAAWANGDDASNFDHCREELYISPGGNWFIEGWGGARSRYGERYSDGSYGSGGRIRPITAERAMRWLEKRQETEALMAYFGNAIDMA